MNCQHTFIQFIYYGVTPQNVGCIIETVLHMIIELLSLLVRVISWFSVSPPWSLTLLICIFISSYVLSNYKKTTPFKLLWTLENYWTWWEIHFRTVTLTIITITIIIVINDANNKPNCFIAGQTTATTRVAEVLKSQHLQVQTLYS